MNNKDYGFITQKELNMIYDSSLLSYWSGIFGDVHMVWDEVLGDVFDIVSSPNPDNAAWMLTRKWNTIIEKGLEEDKPYIEHVYRQAAKVYVLFIYLANKIPGDNSLIMSELGVARDRIKDYLLHTSSSISMLLVNQKLAKSYERMTDLFSGFDKRCNFPTYNVKRLENLKSHGCKFAPNPLLAEIDGETVEYFTYQETLDMKRQLDEQRELNAELQEEKTKMAEEIERLKVENQRLADEVNVLNAVANDVGEAPHMVNAQLFVFDLFFKSMTQERRITRKDTALAFTLIMNNPEIKLANVYKNTNYNSPDFVINNKSIVERLKQIYAVFKFGFKSNQKKVDILGDLIINSNGDLPTEQYYQNLKESSFTSK